MHKTIHIASLAILLAAAALAQPSGQPDTAEVDRAYRALDGKIREVVETYLRTDCEIGEVGVALKRVLALGGPVRPYLTAVERQGPPQPVLLDFNRGLDANWEARQRFLKTRDARELGEGSFKMMAAITREQYLADQQGAIQAKYRERAALALRALGYPGPR
ncbi:MAG TPA: hypothetical protein VGR07_05375 [Thermoanaerobaculia bacterium]|nr:hypothetical protein [Thermoanaerobaculia bacterium]